MTTKIPRKAEPVSNGVDQDDSAAEEFGLERYKYILQQIHTLNENVYKFLAVYQTLATAILGGALGLFIGYKKWGISPSFAKSGLIALLWLDTVVALFTGLLIFIGILNWLDYRREECDLTDEMVRPGFREAPRKANFFRWYETYIIVFILASTVLVWVYALTLLVPSIK